MLTKQWSLPLVPGFCMMLSSFSAGMKDLYDGADGVTHANRVVLFAVCFLNVELIDE
jgi:hypothetical protein